MPRILMLLLLAVIIAGCSTGQYKVPVDEYRQQVKTLGVLPLLVDEQSTLLHPDREAVLELLVRHNVGKDTWLIEALRDQKAYFDVREVPGAPQALFQQLVTGSSIQGDGEERYRRYVFNGAVATELARRSSVDGLLVVILNGIVRNEKLWDRDRTSLNFLQTDHNVVVASAAVVRPGGEVVWDNGGLAGSVLLDLQYPDFDEAYYQLSDQIRLRFVSLAGLDRVLSRRDSEIFVKSSLSQRYKELFATLTSSLTPGLTSLFRRDADGGSRPGSDGKTGSGMK